MDKFDYLIIGGGVAGTTAAETIRQHDASGRVAIVSDEPHRFYSRIMLSKPNFFLEKIPFDQIWLKKESWYAENNIQLLASKKAVKLDAAKKAVTLDDGIELNYNKLLLAVGGLPRKRTIPGADKAGVFYLRMLDEAKAIMSALKTTKRAVAIGGGFINFEMCEVLRLADIEVTLVIREPHYWDGLLDEPAGRMIEAALERGGVRIIHNAEITNISGERIVKGVMLTNGAVIQCDLILVGIGVFSPLDWLKPAGLSANRGLLTNEYLETNLPDVWAAGDATEFNNIITGQRVQLGNWVNAQVQGRIAGLNMTGGKEPFRLVSCYTSRAFGTSVAFVGDVRPLPARIIIARGSPEINSYVRMIAQGDKLVGATLINRTQELSLISKIIEKNVNISGKENKFADPNTDLKQLLV